MAKLESILAKREGGKSQAKIGDIRQLVKQLKDYFAERLVEDPSLPPIELVELLNDIMQRRNKLRAKAMKQAAKSMKKKAK